MLRRTLALLPGLVPPARQAWFAFAGALLWVVHPLQTGAVTYLAQRTESLSGMFALVAMLAFVRSETTARRAAWSAAALVALALSTATKEVTIVLPVLMLLHDRTFVAGSFRAALARRPAFYALLGVTTAALAALFLAPIFLAADSTAGLSVASVTPLEYARTQPGVILHYLRLAAWPRGLCLDYMWPVARAPLEWVPQALVLAVLLAATAWALARRSWTGFAGAWFFVLLAPSSSVIPIQDIAFEHRMYLPLATPVVLVLAALVRATASRQRLQVALLASLAVALGAATLDRNRDYSSAARLWTTVVERAPHNWRAYLGLGTALQREGRAAEAAPALARSAEIEARPNTLLLLGQAHEATGDLEAALAAYDGADALRPGHGETLLHRGVVRLKQGALADATRDLEAALARLEDPALRVTALHDLALAALRANDFPGAERRFREALELAPLDAGLCTALGQTLLELRRFTEAAAELQRAVELAPDAETAHAALGAALAALGRHAEALPHQERALALPPATPREHHDLAETLQALGRTDAALEEWRAAARAGPRFTAPRVRLAETLLARPRPTPAEVQEALAAAGEAERLTGGRQPEVLALLGAARAAAGDRAGAIEALERALATGPDAGLAAELARRIAELRDGA